MERATSPRLDSAKRDDLENRNPGTPAEQLAGGDSGQQEGVSSKTRSRSQPGLRAAPCWVAWWMRFRKMVGGSADLTPSNNTKTKDMTDIKPDAFGGRYIHFGVREHGMAAALNGLALHGGLIPYGGTFMCFFDYCKPAVRLAALMKIRSIFVMTHDSIGLGEDGPTHQPIEHLAAATRDPVSTHLQAR